MADKITYYLQWTWPKWVVPYRLWRFVLPCYVQKYGIGKWVVPYRLWRFSHKFKNPMSTPHYFSFPLILSATHIILTIIHIYIYTIHDIIWYIYNIVHAMSMYIYIHSAITNGGVLPMTDPQVTMAWKKRRWSQRSRDAPVDQRSSGDAPFIRCESHPRKRIISGWWLSHPSEKYEFVSWVYSSQYMGI